jgi:hypothetical protein
MVNASPLPLLETIIMPVCEKNNGAAEIKKITAFTQQNFGQTDYCNST